MTGDVLGLLWLFFTFVAMSFRSFHFYIKNDFKWSATGGTCRYACLSLSSCWWTGIPETLSAALRATAASAPSRAVGVLEEVLLAAQELRVVR